MPEAEARENYANHTRYKFNRKKENGVRLTSIVLRLYCGYIVPLLRRVLKPVKPTIMAMQLVLFPHDKLHDDKAEKDEEITGNVVFAF